jgi:RNA polymerase sigma-70 factor (ECF subfamily)
MIGHPGGYHGHDLEYVPDSQRRPFHAARDEGHTELGQPLPTDEALMQAYAAGDASAFHELFRRYAPRLLALFRCGGSQDASDLVQQTFLQLHRARTSYYPEAPFRPWLMTIARNLRRDHFRRLRRRPIGTEEFAGQSMIAPGSSAEVVLELKRALRALRDLPAREREVIALRCASGLSVAETALQLGSTEAAVKARAQRGYRRLREST